MSTILRHIVDDIIVDLRQIFDDKKIQKSQVAYWTIIVGNRLRAQHIEKRSSGAFLTTFPVIPVLESDTPSQNLPRGRKYFELPQTIYDFNDDDAINYISYSVDPELIDERAPLTNITFTRTTPSSLEGMYMNPYTSPDSTNPYFYRSGSKIFLIGLECIDIDYLEVGLYLSIPPITEIDLDEVFDFPDELILVLKKNVLEMGRFALMIPSDRINEGTDSIAPNQITTSKIVSVNDPINLSE